jgi:hypothetical protein
MKYFGELTDVRFQPGKTWKLPGAAMFPAPFKFGAQPTRSRLFKAAKMPVCHRAAPA